MEPASAPALTTTGNNERRAGSFPRHGVPPEVDEVSRDRRRRHERGTMRFKYGRPSMLRHWGVLGALGTLTALTVLPAVGLPLFPQPYNPDNIWALRLGAEPIGSYFTDPPDGIYRPLGYVTLWAQYHLGGLDPSAYFAVNIALWIGAGCVVYLLGYTLAGSQLAAGVAAALMLVDERGMTAIVWIPERATTIACVMGGVALLLAYRLPRGGTSRTAALAGITALLLGAALSKEYGVTFAAATAAVGLVARPHDRAELAAVALGALTAYAAMRTLLPGDATLAAAGHAGSSHGALDGCEYIGFLGHGENVCYGELDVVDRLLRWGWNAGATLVATFLPPLFTGQGALLLPDVLAGPLGEAETYPGFSIRSLILPLFISACALVGLRRYPRAVLPLFVLIVANAALSFLLFRDRNQVVGMVGLYTAAAVGLPLVASESLTRARGIAQRSQALARVRARAAVPLAAIALVAGAIGWRAADFHDAVAGAKSDYADRDPCPELRGVRPGVAERLRSALGPAASRCKLTKGH